MLFKSTRYVLSVAAATLLLPTYSAFAQDDEPIIEEIIVAGSRIPRPTGVDSPTPMTVVDAEDLSLSGQLSLGDYLNELPALRSTFSTQNSTRFIGTTALSILDLRGLGTARTLVLVDGLRHVGGINGTSSVDINSIPPSLVDRVEVITGGASAIYGADAVTGVVNFVMKHDFEGLEVAAFGADPEEGGGDNWDGEITWGMNFAEGRGNITAHYSHTEYEKIRGTQRDWINEEWLPSANEADTGPDDGIPDFIWRRNSRINLYNNNGVIWGPDQIETITAFPGDGAFATIAGALDSGPYTFTNTGSLTPFDPGQTFLTQDGVFDAYSVGGDGLALAPETMVYPTVTQDNFFARGEFEFNRHALVSFEGKYSRLETFMYTSPTFDVVWDSDTFIAPDNAFIPADLAAILAVEDPISIFEGFAPGFYLNRIHADLGLRGEEHERETQRYVLGLEGDLTDQWSYHSALIWGRMENDATSLNNRNDVKFANAVDAVDLGGGQIGCRDAAARADGCLPLNLFGYGLSDPAAVAYIMEPDSTWDEELTQTVLTAYVRGPLVELPAGNLDAAFGIEYRKEESKVSYSDVIKSGETFFNALADTDADYDVKEAFAEVSVPVMRGLPWAEDVIVDAAWRYSDYDTIGSTNTYKLGVDWVVLEDVRLRATKSRAVRAPNIGELFDPLQQNFFFVDDPCSDSQIPNAPDPALRQTNCLALGKPAGGYESSNDNVTIGGLSGGNENLSEEEAETLTYGVVLTPRWVPNLTITVDYWDIDLDDAISGISAQTILEKCVDAPSIDNIYCPLITRDADFDLNPTEGIVQQQLNISRLVAKGIDWDVGYMWDLGETFGGNMGALDFHVFGTNLKRLDAYPFSNEPDVKDDDRGELGDPVNQFNGSVEYRRNALTLSYRFQWLDEMLLVANDDREDLETPRTTDPVAYHHLQARYSFEDVLGGSIEVYGGVNNLFNTEPEQYLTGIGAGSGIYDVFARTYYLGFRYRILDGF